MGRRNRRYESERSLRFKPEKCYIHTILIRTAERNNERRTESEFHLFLNECGAMRCGNGNRKPRRNTQKRHVNWTKQCVKFSLSDVRCCVRSIVIPTTQCCQYYINWNTFNLIRSSNLTSLKKNYLFMSWLNVTIKKITIPQFKNLTYALKTIINLLI